MPQLPGSAPPSCDATLRRTLFALFVVLGISTATWVTRMPAVRDALQVTTEQIGLILFGFSAGSMGGILTANWLVQCVKARQAAAWGLGTNLLGLGLLAAGVSMVQVPVVVAGFVLFGMGMGWADIAVNIEAGALERLQQRSLMTTLHGCFSLGAMLGAVAGALMAWGNVAVVWHLAAVVVVAAAALPALLRRVHNHSAALAAQSGGLGSGFVLQAFRDPRVLLIGLFALGLALTEGAAHDWLTLLMVDGYGFDNAQATWVYTLFTLGVTVSRLSGHRLLQRWSRLQLMRASAFLGAVGLLMVVLADALWLGAVGVACWGMGSALGFPLALSAAADGEGDSAQRVGAVAALGYVAILVGPPVLGLWGESWGLRLAMLPVCVACCMALALTWRMRPLQPGKVAQTP